MPSAADPTDLSDVPLLTALPPEARHRLERAARLVDVPAGALLIREGDPPGSAFVVRRGRLEVEVGRPGGARAGLRARSSARSRCSPGEQRSAAVRARRDSTVIEIPRDAFESMLDRDPRGHEDRAEPGRGPAAHRRVTARPAAARAGSASSRSSGCTTGPGCPPWWTSSCRRMSRAPLRRGTRRRRAGRPGACRARPRPRRAGRPRPRARPGGRRLAGRLRPAGGCRRARGAQRRTRAGDAVRARAGEPARARPRGTGTDARAPRGLGRGHRRPAADDRRRRPRRRAARPGRPARRPVARPRPRRRRGPRVLPRRRAARARGRGPARRPGGRQQHRRGHRRAARDRDGRGLPRGAVLRRVGAPPAVQRLAAADDVPREGPPRAQRDGAQPAARTASSRGCPRQLQVVSVDLVSRTRQVHRRGSVVDAALASARLPVLFAPHAPGRRAAARRRRRARQPADRPARRRATRDPSSRSTSVRGAGTGAPAVPACPRSATP